MNWQNAIKEYQLYLKIERGLSKNTIDSYTKDLEKLCLFLKENNTSKATSNPSPVVANFPNIM